MEDSRSDDLFEEDEEEGGKGDGPPTQMLCRGVIEYLKNESRSSLGVDGSLEGSLRPSVFWSLEFRLS